FCYMMSPPTIRLAFTSFPYTTLFRSELLTEVAVPKMPKRTGVAFQEVSRRHGDFALVGVAASITLDESGTCARARIALLSVGSRDRKSTRLNSSHSQISYDVFCLKKK